MDSCPAERKDGPPFTVEDDVSKYLSKRRHTERIPDGLSPFRCRQNNHSYGNRNGGTKNDKNCRCTQRRHTLVPGVSEVELFEKETKLIVLEFLQVSTPRLDTKSRCSIGETRDVFIREHKTSNEDEEIEQKSNKRAVKRQRKVSKSKTVTLGEADRKEINEYQVKERKKFKRSSSEMTSLQYSMMRRKFQEMQSPIIQWLKDHIEEESEDVSISQIPDITTTGIEEEISSLDVKELESIPEDTDDSLPYVEKATRKSLLQPPSKSLRLTIPRRSIALQLVESNLFTPETIAVQKLEKISENIMKDYGDILNKSMADLLNPIRVSNYITYDLFSSVANKVYNIASGETLARLAMVLNLVRETMVEGNLNESQLEMLVDHSTKFFTENASESPLKHGNGWDQLGMRATDPSLPETKNEEEIVERENLPGGKLIEKNAGDEDDKWKPYGFAALTVGLGIAYSYLKT